MGPSKRCTRCGEWKLIYDPVKKRYNFHKQGIRRGKQQFNSRCIPCQKIIWGEKEHSRKRDTEHNKARMRARSRALTRLTKLVPELYLRLFTEECKIEGIEVDLKTLEAYRHIDKDIRKVG